MLRQAYDEYLFYQAQITACEEIIKEQLLNQAAKILEGEIIDIRLKKKPKKNQFSFEIQPLLKIIVGVDLCEVDGINEVSCLELISEIGSDMSKWNSGKHMSAWLNVGS